MTSQLSWQPPPVTKCGGCVMTQQEALYHFEYLDGRLIYKNKVPRSSKVALGEEVGNRRPDGYIKVNFKRKQYYAHRIIYLMHHGFYPDEVDHIDRNPRNNKIENLRSATRSENAANRGVGKSNKSGFLGVFWNTQSAKWNAKIKINGKDKHLGFYDLLEDAASAYETASKRYHGKFSPYVAATK
jgi:HNH endonuclease